MRGSCVLPVLTSVGVIPLGACREEVEAPTAPGGPEETPAFATAAALSFRQVSVGGASSFWVNAGGNHTCGVTLDGSGFCWGINLVGQLGDGTRTRRLRPTALGVALTLTQVSTANGTSCGVATNQRIYCWGDNFAGQLGDGTNTDHLLPTRVAGPM
jgi:alpha-tubulin suppressor-like RCC1 family protein